MNESTGYTELGQIIARSQSGMYHIGNNIRRPFGGSHTSVKCSFWIADGPATVREVRQADEEMFCEKCFPDGKPKFFK